LGTKMPKKKTVNTVLNQKFSVREKGMGVSNGRVSAIGGGGVSHVRFFWDAIRRGGKVTEKGGPVF